MHDDASGTTFLQALKDRYKLAIKTVAAVFLIAGAAAFLTRQYSASAVVAMNPAAAVDAEGTSRSAVEVAWTALTDKQIASIIDQFRLDSGMARLRAQGEVFTYLRSNFLLHELDSPGSPAPEVVISYTGDAEETTIEAANAVAQALASENHQTDVPSASSGALPKNQSDIQISPQSQNAAQAQADLQKTLRAGALLQAELRDTLRDTTQRLAALQEESDRTLAAVAKPHTQPPQPTPPVRPDPRRLALEQQIRQAQSHLTELLTRYTDNYPDVQDARETLWDLQTKLNQLPPEQPQRDAPKVAAPVLPTSSSASMREIAREQDRLRAIQSDLELRIRENHQAAQMLRTRLADPTMFDANSKDNAFEQQHYSPLLKGGKPADNTKAVPAYSFQGPLFIVVKTATSAEELGLFTKPLFWLATLLAALIAASAAVFLAGQFAPLDEMNEDTERRSVHIS